MAPAPRPLAIVTGASSGIGEAIAGLLAPDHDLVLVARRRELLDRLGERLSAQGCSARVLALDLAAPGAVDELARQVPACDVLVNNAGFGLRADLAVAPPEAVASQLDLNVRALTMLCRAYLPGMVERRRGGILNVASIGAFLPTPGMAVYSASKAYVLAFSTGLRAEVKEAGVHVTCLCPGPTESGFMDAAGLSVEKDFPLVPRRIVFMDPLPVARTGLRALRRNTPHVVAGWRNKPLVFFTRFVPRSLIAWIAGLTMREKKR